MVDLNEFLASKGTSLAEVFAQAERSVPIGEDDMLLAVGSLVEGLGTTKSDVDLLLLTRRTAADLPAEDHVTWVSGKSLVDMQILPGPVIEDLLDRFRAWSEAPFDPTDFAPFKLEQRTLLHRIAVSPRLARDAADEEPYKRPSRRALARLKLHVARHEARTVQVDMTGLRVAGDYRSLAFAATQLMGLAIDAILAGHLITNFTPKWRSRLLEDVPDDWQAGLGPRRGGSAGAEIWRLLRFPESWDASETLPFALDVSAYARAAFAWAEETLLGTGDSAAAPATPPAPEAGAGDPLPHLDFDVDYSFAGADARLGRLNEFDAPLRLSRAELAAALLFDGRTGAGEADAWVFARHGERIDSRGLAERCAAQGLLADGRDRI